MEGYLHKHPTSIIKEDFLRNKEVASTSQSVPDQDSPFVYKSYFDNLSLWNENLFSLRLANCLRKYPIVPGAIARYTAREGHLFGKEEISKYFIFHGSPDITLAVKVESNVHENIVDRQRARTGNEEQIRGYAVIENKVLQVNSFVIDDVLLPEISKVLDKVLMKNLLSNIGTMLGQRLNRMLCHPQE